MAGCVQARTIWMEPSPWPVFPLSSVSAVEKPCHSPPSHAILRLLTHQAQWGSSQAPGLGTASSPPCWPPPQCFKKYTVFQVGTVLMTVTFSRQLPVHPEAPWPVAGSRGIPL